MAGDKICFVSESCYRLHFLIGCLVVDIRLILLLGKVVRQNCPCERTRIGLHSTSLQRGNSPYGVVQVLRDSLPMLTNFDDLCKRHHSLDHSMHMVLCCGRRGELFSKSFSSYEWAVMIRSFNISAIQETDHSSRLFFSPFLSDANTFEESTHYILNDHSDIK